jgi:hypothetical protein
MSFRTSEFSRIGTLGNRYFGASASPLPDQDFSRGRQCPTGLSLVWNSGLPKSVRESIRWRRGEGIESAVKVAPRAQWTISEANAEKLRPAPPSDSCEVQRPPRARMVTFDI